MAITLFVVRATIAKDKEAAFNAWYDNEHAPQVLQFNGAVSARRYRKILGDDKFQYMAVYEFASEAVFQRFLASDHLKALVKDYEASFGAWSERERAAIRRSGPKPTRRPHTEPTRLMRTTALSVSWRPRPGKCLVGFPAILHGRAPIRTRSILKFAARAMLCGGGSGFDLAAVGHGHA